MDPITLAILTACHVAALTACGLARYVMPSLAAMAGLYVAAVLIFSL